MRYIFCKKCGSKIDADLGVCPVCGAVYYVLDDIDTAGDAAPDMRSEKNTGYADLDETQVFQRPVGFDSKDTERVRPDRVNIPDDESTTKFRIDDSFRSPKRQTAEQGGDGGQRGTAYYGDEPQQRARNKQPAAHSAGQTGKTPHQKKKKKSRVSRGFVVGAVFLLALLTIVISAMSGAFNFSGKEKSGNKMPNVVGMTVEKATEMLKEQNVGVTVEMEASDEPKGNVIRQSIKEGQTLHGGETATLTVSSGAQENDDEKVDIPDLKNKTFDAAKKELSELGLSISQTSEVYDNSIAEGKIVSQSPLSGGKASKGTTIYVTVSKGVEPTPTPAAHVITVTAGQGGSVSPRGQVEVAEGKSVTFTITPDNGYEVREVKVDGQNVGAVTEYTLSNVTGNHSVYVVFSAKAAVTEPPQPTQAPDAGNDPEIDPD